MNLASIIFFATILNKRFPFFSESKVSQLLSYFEIYTFQVETRDKRNNNDKILEKRRKKNKETYQFINTKYTKVFKSQKTRLYA